MEFNEYQRRTADTAIYPGQGTVMGYKIRDGGRECRTCRRTIHYKRNN